jgi:hypothetical protein
MLELMSPHPAGGNCLCGAGGAPQTAGGGGGIWLHPYTPCGDWLSSRLTRTLLPNIGDKPPGAGISVVPLLPPSPVVLANNLVNPHPPVKSSTVSPPLYRGLWGAPWACSMFSVCDMT